MAFDCQRYFWVWREASMPQAYVHSPSKQNTRQGRKNIVVIFLFPKITYFHLYFVFLYFRRIHFLFGKKLKGINPKWDVLLANPTKRLFKILNSHVPIKNNVITCCNFQGPVGSTGITGAPGTKGEMVWNITVRVHYSIFLVCRYIAQVVTEGVFVISDFFGRDLLLPFFRAFELKESTRLTMMSFFSIYILY